MDEMPMVADHAPFRCPLSAGRPAVPRAGRRPWSWHLREGRRSRGRPSGVL